MMLNFSMEFKCPIPSSNNLILGTLGPSGTSSEEALNYVIDQLKQQKINTLVKLFDDFTLLREALQTNQVDLALVPHAYHKINDFYMEPDLDLGLIFTYPTPVYGLAQRKDAEFDKSESLNECTIVTHPAPLPLLSRLLTTNQNQQDVKVELANSTSAAALQVQQGLAQLAITNEKACKSHDLEFISIYGTIPMSWSVFYKKTEQSHV